MTPVSKNETDLGDSNLRLLQIMTLSLILLTLFTIVRVDAMTNIRSEYIAMGGLSIAGLQVLSTLFVPARFMIAPMGAWLFLNCVFLFALPSIL